MRVYCFKNQRLKIVKVNVGDVFTNSFIIDQSVYDGFINVFRDCNPLHLDDIFAQKNGFNSKVMHGNILGGFLSFFIGECLPIKNVIIHSQQIKYLKPVYLSDNLVLNAIVESVHHSVNVIDFKFQFERKVDTTIVAKGKIQIGLLN